MNKHLYASQNKNARGRIFLGFAILFATAFLFFIYYALAFFTASAERQGTVTFGSTVLNALSYNSSTGEYETGAALNVQERNLNTQLVPGDTIDITSTRIKNNGTAEMYAVVKVTLTVKNTGVETLTYDKWCDCEGNEFDAENFAINQTGASLLTANSYKQFATSFQIPGELGNEYQGGKASVKLAAYGIQSQLPNAECYVDESVYASYTIVKNLTSIQEENPAKNLFGIEDRQVINTYASSAWANPNSTKRTALSNNHLIVGITSNNYYDPAKISELSYSNGIVSFKTSSSGYGVGFDFECDGNSQTYTLSKSDSNLIGVTYYSSDGSYISDVTSTSTSYTFTPPSNATHFVITLRPNILNTLITYSNLQLELGSTATTYQPYFQYDLVPNGYKVVEYIESTGTQYINTGYSPKSKTKANVKLSFLDLSYGSAVMGAWNSSTDSRWQLFYVYSDGSNHEVLDFGYGSNGNAYGVNISENVVYNILMYQQDGKVKLFVDNSSWLYDTPSYVDSGYNMFLFGRNRNNSINSPSKIKLYSCKIYENDVVVRCFIPCVRKVDGVAGLFDTVNNVFYTNAGTGDFVTSEKTIIEPLQQIISTKNLLDKDACVEGFQYSDNGSDTLIWDSYGTDFINASPNTTYTVSGMASKCTSFVVYYNYKKEMLSRTTAHVTNSETITTPANCKYIRVAFYLFTGGNTFNDIKDDLQLEKGSSATTYQSYNGVKDTYAWSTRTVTRKVLKVEFTGTENDASVEGVWNIWNNSVTETSSGVYYYAFNILGTYGSPKIDDDYAYSSHYKSGGHPIGTSTAVGSYYISDGSNPPYIAIRVPYTNLTDWKAYLASEYTSGNPVTFWLKLATPVVTTY